jgi:hypothetical protein
VAYVEGTVKRYFYDAQGNSSNDIKWTPRFSLWRAGSKWAIRVLMNANLPGGITEVASDGTNIYTLVPGAGGKQEVGKRTQPFVNAASVYPGTVKDFGVATGPIWWGYCSSCVISNDGIVRNFLRSWA